MKKIKIFMGAQEIGGKMGILCEAFKKIGIQAEYFCLYEYVAGDKKLSNNSVILKIYKFHTEKIRGTKKRFVKRLWGICQMVDTLILFVYALAKYNTYIYIAGHGIFFYNYYLSKITELEFKILKLFKKNVFMWFCGSDSRAPYCGCDLYQNDYEKMRDACITISNNVRMIEKYATLIDYPSSAHFHTKPYIISNTLGRPVDSSELMTENHVDSENSVVRILHVPSKPQFKGTVEIRNIINEIKEEGYSIKYTELTGVKHSEVLKQFANTDILIDQMYSDIPLTGIGAEASINGIPVVVGGYYAEQYQKTLAKPIPPTVFCLPEDLKSKLIYLICNKEARIEIGNAEKKFINEYCLSNLVAKRFVAIIEGTEPESWWFKPETSNYIYGVSLSKQQVVHNVVEMIDRFGMDSLCIDNRYCLFEEYLHLYEMGKREKVE